VILAGGIVCIYSLISIRIRFTHDKTIRAKSEFPRFKKVVYEEYKEISLTEFFRSSGYNTRD